MLREPIPCGNEPAWVDVLNPQDSAFEPAVLPASIKNTGKPLCMIFLSHLPNFFVRFLEGIGLFAFVHDFPFNFVTADCSATF
jgi:hypothetical protein